MAHCFSRARSFFCQRVINRGDAAVKEQVTTMLQVLAGQGTTALSMREISPYSLLFERTCDRRVRPSHTIAMARARKSASAGRIRTPGRPLAPLGLPPAGRAVHGTSAPPAARTA